MKATAFKARPPRARALLRLFAAVGALILVTALAGCGGDPPTKPPNTSPTYVPSSSPQNALLNLEQSYTFRDSSAYDSLFDAAYIGSSYDPTGPSPVPLTFTKADESLHIRALARSGASVHLQLPPILTRSGDAADTVGWATVQMVGMGLQIYDNSGTSFSVNSSETMEFKFRPTTPSPGSPTDTTWRIVRWTEVAP